jgi:hypothetical protein
MATRQFRNIGTEVIHMALVVSVLIIVAFLFGVALGVITLIVAGIRSDDRAKTLTDAPRTRVEAATRRMLGAGGYNGNADSCEHGRE